MLRDIKSNVDVVQALAPAGRTTGTATSNAVDLQGYGSAMAIFNTGAWTDGTHTPSLLESADGTTYTAVAAADQLGAFVAVSGTAQQNAVQRVGYVGNCRYLKAQLLSGTSTTGVISGVSVVRGKASVAPLA